MGDPVGSPEQREDYMDADYMDNDLRYGGQYRLTFAVISPIVPVLQGLRSPRRPLVVTQHEGGTFSY
jgi:hypothetical protein